MGHSQKKILVFTLKDSCKVCYTCVRECPVKAIRINNGQAEVMSERCIACGNCVKVCSRGAKFFLDNKYEAIKLLEDNSNVIACIAPSFPAEFNEISDYRILVSMIRKLGFAGVIEVGFAADIISEKYLQMHNSNPESNYISSDCPAIVNYIEQYYPELVSNLAPIVSPMVASARIVREKYGNDSKVVFIGPCVAKKSESDEIEAVLTFKELRELFELLNIKPENSTPTDFDTPFAGRGSIFPVTRGMLQTIKLTDDITEGKIIVADGKNNYKEVIKEFSEGNISANHLELLCCEGCILGPGMTKKGKKFALASCVNKYVKNKLETFDEKGWKEEVDKYSDIDYSRTFTQKSMNTDRPAEEEINNILFSFGKRSKSDHLNCGACGYDTCEDFAIAILGGLAETEMCLPYIIDQLHNSIEELNITNDHLATARQALKQSEKLAGMGQLSAGIAHELNNPLGVVIMYANILKDEADPDSPIVKDLELIVEQAERCKKIVGGLLNFARKNQVNLEEVNLKEFCFHSISSVIIPDNIRVEFINNLPDPFIMVDKDQMMQVLTNLEKNAVEAMPNGGSIEVECGGTEEKVYIRITDTGIGISQENLDKLFTPFFTTKKMGKGTGLGLPLVYGIIKMHKGKINVSSNTNPDLGKTGTTFKIVLPRNPNI